MAEATGALEKTFRSGRVARCGTFAGLVSLIVLAGCSRPDPSSMELTAYVAADRRVSEPILQEFERRSGVRVTAVYEGDDATTGGLANRLLSEQGATPADILWSSVPMQSLRLKYAGVLASYRPRTAAGIADKFQDVDGYWVGFSARVRVIIYNSHQLVAEAAPQSVLDLVEPRWKGRVAIADPRLDSTSSFQVAALYEALGDADADQFFRKLKANDLKILSSSRAVLDAVAQGVVLVGLADSDDAKCATNANRPIAMVLPDLKGIGVPVMPNIVSLIDRAPHPVEAKRLIDYLVSEETERVLALSSASQMPLHLGVEGPVALPPVGSLKTLPRDCSRNASRAERVIGRLALIFGW
jgi:iron(III) transport system substrate-binding protein